MSEKKDGEAKAAAARYCTWLQLARKDPDPLVGLIADDLDLQQTNIYILEPFNKGNVHPKCPGLIR